MITVYIFTAESRSVRIQKISQHLANLWAATAPWHILFIRSDEKLVFLCHGVEILSEDLSKLRRAHI